MMTLAEVAKITDGLLYGEDRPFDGVTNDSRTVEQDNLFVAIPGENFDGHLYLDQAEKSGAVGALVNYSSEIDFPQVVVKDTTLALGQIAAQWRTRFGLPVIAVTGSNGKTSVTAMIATILRSIGSSLAPQKSFNNQWGVPLTLLKLNQQHQFAVLEMGTNHPGEIEYLTRIVRPDIALINNAAAAHMQGLGDINQIARAKSEIYSGLDKQGVVIINADDAFAHQWMSDARSVITEGAIITFALENPADITASNLQLMDEKSQFDLHLLSEVTTIQLPLPGRHNVMNALAACAACHAAGAGLQTIKTALEQVNAVQGRLNFRRGLQGSTVIDDSYNANPASIKAGIDVLASHSGEKWLVLGDMAELGDASALLHREVGQYAKLNRIDKLICLAGNEFSDAQSFVDGFGPGAEIFDVYQPLVDYLKSLLHENVVVLVKGSRSAGMERVVAEISAAKVEEVSQC